MKKFSLFYFSVPMLLLVLSLGSSMTANAQASTAHSVPSWQIVPSANPSVQYNALNGVAAISGSNAWAVGMQTGYPNASQALIEHWNGKVWGLVPAPAAGLGSSLNAVAQIPSTHNLWAVGNYIDSQSSTYQTLAERWNGTSWSVIPTPFFKTDPENTSNTLYGVSALSPKDAWAIGVHDNGQGQFQVPLIEHWNGTQWTATAVPTPTGTTFGYLYSIVALSAKNVWAVGTSSTTVGGGEQVLIDHWNGSSWSLVTGQNPGSIANFLYSVTRIPGTNQLWAAGQYLNGGAYQTLIERWDGTQWNLVSSPSPGTNDNTLQSVASVTPDDAWAVGSDTSGNGDSPLIEHWNGTTWSLVTSPLPSDTVFLSAVTRIPESKHLWAVGNYYATVNNQFDQFTLTEIYR